MLSLSQLLTESSQIDQYITKDLREYNATITTITCFVSMNTEIITKKIFEIADDTTQWQSICATVGHSLHVRFPGTRKNSKSNHKSFYNSVSVVFKRNGRTICSKVFRTGVHITGCRSFEDCVSAANIVAQMIGLVQQQQESIYIKGYKIQMVNILMDFGQTVYLQELYEELQSLKLNCLYDREVYCGLRIKVPKEEGKTCTFIIFPSGKAMLAGAKAAKDVQKIKETIFPKLSKFLQS